MTRTIQVLIKCTTAVVATTTFRVEVAIPTFLRLIDMAHILTNSTSMTIISGSMTVMKEGQVGAGAEAEAITEIGEIETTTITIVIGNLEDDVVGHLRLGEVAVITMTTIVVAIGRGGTTHVHPAATAAVVSQEDVDADVAARVRGGGGHVRTLQVIHAAGDGASETEGGTVYLDRDLTSIVHDPGIDLDVVVGIMINLATSHKKKRKERQMKIQATGISQHRYHHVLPGKIVANKTEKIRNEEAVKDQETGVDTIDQGVGAEVVAEIADCLERKGEPRRKRKSRPLKRSGRKLVVEATMKLREKPGPEDAKLVQVRWEKERRKSRARRVEVDGMTRITGQGKVKGSVEMTLLVHVTIPMTTTFLRRKKGAAVSRGNAGAVMEARQNNMILVTMLLRMGQKVRIR